MTTSSKNRRSLPTTRRAVLQGGLALVAGALTGCGGGGGDEGNGGGAPDTAPAGRLVYRNSGVAAVYHLAIGQELQFDPGENLSLDPGMSVSATGIVSVARGSDNAGFDFALYGLDGKERSVHRVGRELAFQNSTVMFNADATRMAVSVNEPRSPTDDTRIDRTLVALWPSGTLIASLDGYVEPVWAGNTGELVVRHTDTQRLRLFDDRMNDRGNLANVVVGPLIGGYSASADGRYLVWDAGDSVRVHDRDTDTGWVAATDRTSSLHTPCISPDGRHLAVIARGLLAYVPHVMPFARDLTVAVDSDIHALDNTLADCRARMGWTA